MRSYWMGFAPSKTREKPQTRLSFPRALREDLHAVGRATDAVVLQVPAREREAAGAALHLGQSRGLVVQAVDGCMPAGVRSERR